MPFGWRRNAWGSVIALILSLAGSAAASAASSRLLRVVIAPVADLRAKPGSALPTSAIHDPLQETQLLYGERVKLLNTDGDWAFIEAIEQPEYTHHHRWQGYPGWVRSDRLQPLHSPGHPNAIIATKWASVWQDAQGTVPRLQLPIGTKVRVTNTAGERWPLQLFTAEPAWIARSDVRLMRALQRLPDSSRRQAIVSAAETFLGDPYFWGGRSPFAEPTGHEVTGVDCSGLVNLAYRSVGLDIPRDAHEQYLRARKIATPKPADLVFLSAPDDPAKIVHVMVYAGEGWLIEGPGTGLAVRRIRVSERLGRPIEQLTSGERLDRQTLFFGAYLP